MKRGAEGTTSSNQRARSAAAGLTLGYLVVCTLYILLSTHAVSRLAVDVLHMEHFEQAKGLFFVVVSGLAFYEFCRRVLLRIEARERELARNRDALVEAERRALAGAFASSIAHDMNNILTVLGTGAEELAQAGESDGKTVEAAGRVERAVRDIAALARRLAAMGKESGEGRIEEVDLVDLLRESADFARAHHAIRSCSVRVAGQRGVRIRAAPRALGGMALNLLLNAAEATKGRGRIEVRVSRSPEGAAVVEFHDNGPGVSDDARDRLFTAFFTTKSTGTGLGLLSAHATAVQHGGSVTYEPSPLGGACFRVVLRDATSDAEANRPPEGAAA